MTCTTHRLSVEVHLSKPGDPWELVARGQWFRGIRRSWITHCQARF